MIFTCFSPGHIRQMLGSKKGKNIEKLAAGLALQKYVSFHSRTHLVYLTTLSEAFHIHLFNDLFPSPMKRHSIKAGHHCWLDLHFEVCSTREWAVAADQKLFICRSLSLKVADVIAQLLTQDGLRQQLLSERPHESLSHTHKWHKSTQYLCQVFLVFLLPGRVGTGIHLQ